MGFSYFSEEQRVWIAQNMPLVQEHVADSVLAFGVFHRSRGEGLPASFVLVFTPTRLHALAYSRRGGRVAIECELAVWDRSAISVAVEDRKLTKRLVVESAASGERVECEAIKGTATDFVAALGAQAAVATSA